MIRALMRWWHGHIWVSRGLFIVGTNDDGTFVQEEWRQCARCKKWE